MAAPEATKGQGEGGKIRSGFDLLKLVGAKRKFRFGKAAGRFIELAASARASCQLWTGKANHDKALRKTSI